MQEAYPGPQGTHYTVREMCDKGFIPHRNVIAATSYIMYGEMRMTLATSANIDTLNIVKVSTGYQSTTSIFPQSITSVYKMDCGESQCYHKPRNLKDIMSLLAMHLR